MKIPKQEFYVKITVPSCDSYGGKKEDNFFVKNIKDAVRQVLDDSPYFLDIEAWDGEMDCVGPVKYQLKTPAALYKELYKIIETLI